MLRERDQAQHSLARVCKHGKHSMYSMQRRYISNLKGRAAVASTRMHGLMLLLACTAPAPMQLLGKAWLPTCNQKQEGGRAWHKKEWSAAVMRRTLSGHTLERSWRAMSYGA